MGHGRFLLSLELSLCDPARANLMCSCTAHCPISLDLDVSSTPSCKHLLINPNNSLLCGSERRDRHQTVDDLCTPPLPHECGAWRHVPCRVPCAHEHSSRQTNFGAFVNIMNTVRHAVERVQLRMHLSPLGHQSTAASPFQAPQILSIETMVSREPLASTTCSLVSRRYLRTSSLPPPGLYSPNDDV